MIKIAAKIDLSKFKNLNKIWSKIQQKWIQIDIMTSGLIQREY